MFNATTTPPPWSLYSWPAVFWQANSRCRLRWVHWGTRVTTKPRRGRLSQGHTIWGGQRGSAGFAWDWIEITDGVVAMVDPMCVVTNVRLLDRDGAVLPAAEAALHFNQFVRRLPWQEEVQRLLRAA